MSLLKALVGALSVLALLPQFGSASMTQQGALRAGGPAPPSSGGTSGFATITSLPDLGRGSEAVAVNASGAVVAGHMWDRRSLLHAVKWTLHNGAWAATDLPWPPGATSVTARAVNNQGDVAGIDYPGSTSHAVLWPVAGGFTVLGCSGDVGAANVYGMSAGGQVVVGTAGGKAAIWRPGRCRKDLPSLFPGFSAMAGAVNADGTIVGGTAALDAAGDAYAPVRWTLVAGQWQIEQLDSRNGSVLGSNGAGDLAGYVYYLPCASTDGCQHAAIWNADGSFRELGTLGGKDSWARGINAPGEVVGNSTANSGNTGFLWSQSFGMIELPFSGRWAAANGVSDVRADATRLVVGMSSRAVAIVWVVRNP